MDSSNPPVRDFKGWLTQLHQSAELTMGQNLGGKQNWNATIYTMRSDIAYLPPDTRKEVYPLQTLYCPLFVHWLHKNARVTLWIRVPSSPHTPLLYYTVIHYFRCYNTQCHTAIHNCVHSLPILGLFFAMTLLHIFLKSWRYKVSLSSLFLPRLASALCHMTWRTGIFKTQYIHSEKINTEGATPPVDIILVVIVDVVRQTWILSSHSGSSVCQTPPQRMRLLEQNPAPLAWTTFTSKTNTFDKHWQTHNNINKYTNISW